MPQVVNLNRFKKTKAKDERATRADANRVKFGRTKAEKQIALKLDALSQRNLDGHKRDDS